MYCKRCNSLIADGATVCGNCGAVTPVCPQCGNPQNYIIVKRLKLKFVDWAVLVMFFPLSLIYIYFVIKYREEYLNKCAHCGYVENS